MVIKNRYNDPTFKKRFVIGVDRSKMKLFDVHEGEQTLIDDTPTFDKTEIGNKFEGFKLWIEIIKKQALDKETLKNLVWINLKNVVSKNIEVKVNNACTSHIL